MSLQLVVGLGNPGPRYAATRHNAGFWFVDALCVRFGIMLRPNSRFGGELGDATAAANPFRVLRPATFMNHSGQPVAAVVRYYRLPPEAVLVVHDELDLPPGSARLKSGGGHGGHNGLRDIMAHLGSREFLRLRLGIGHPGDSREVIDYVLNRPSAADRTAIEGAIDDALDVMPRLATGELAGAMNILHARKEQP